MNKPRVLISAYACEPGKGSEPGVGWNTVRELSPQAELTVVTRRNNRAPIESSGEDWIGAVRWIYWDPPAWITRLKKGSFGTQWFYLIWQIGVGKAVAKRIDLGQIDLTHHLTFGKYWLPSSLAGLDKPHVFGPVGGGESSPSGLVSGSGIRGWLAEKTKDCLTKLSSWIPMFRRWHLAAAWNFAATEQTERAMRAIGVNRISLLPQSGISVAEVEAIAGAAPGYARENFTSLRLVTASRLIHWKAIDLAIEALALLPPDLDIVLTILQDGPEESRLRVLAKRLGVDSRVDFKGRQPTLGDVYREIRRSDALVHPALHEAFGQACVESLALGVPVICLNWGGPGMIIDQETGFAVRPGTRGETARRIADAILSLSTEISSGEKRSDACRARAADCFEWRNLSEALLAKYRTLAALPAEPT